ncbi:hypothetical protein ACWGN5_24310 [Streptomyces sp. NPDC055815]
MPPVEPDGSWSRRWQAAVGVALAHLVTATEGHPATLPAGPVTELLGHAVGMYLPAGPGARSVGLPGQEARSLELPGQEARSLELPGQEARSLELAGQGARSVGAAGSEARSVELPGPGTRSVGLASPEARSVGLAGPGIPAPRPRPDVLLVRRHPLTGASWRPPGDERAVVPLDSGVWAYLAHRARPRRCPRPGCSRRASCATTTPCRRTPGAP